jgi:hypothetical protein
VIRIGDASSVGDLGYNFVFGGMAADQVWISAEYDSVSKTDRMGQAVSDDIVIGDNGRIERAAGSAGTPNQLLQVVTTQNDKGGDDRILTANGGKVLIGGFGADIIHARDGDNLVMGDNAQIDYDSVSRNGVLRSIVSTDIVIGGNDNITLEEGFKLVSGGFGADTIQIDADNLGNVSGSAATSEAIGAAVWAVGSLLRVTSVVGVAGTLPTGGLSGAALTAAQTGNRGRNGRFIAGDNARFEFDDQSGLTAMATIDPIAATGGADGITLGAQGIAASADLGYQVVMGGMAADTITVRDQTASTDLILGDNGELLRKARVTPPCRSPAACPRAAAPTPSSRAAATSSSLAALGPTPSPCAPPTCRTPAGMPPPPTAASCWAIRAWSPSTPPAAVRSSASRAPTCPLAVTTA